MYIFAVVKSVIIKWKAYIFISLYLVIGCAGPEPSDELIIEESQDSAKIDQVVVDTTEKPFLIEDLTEVDENCSDHFAAAMNQPKPEDLVIVHCEYWSSAHPVWLEHSYRFEFEENELFFEDILDYNQMVQIEDSIIMKEQQLDWFLPKNMTNYVGYYTEDDFDDFQLFKDVTTGNIFIRGSQY